MKAQIILLIFSLFGMGCMTTYYNDFTLNIDNVDLNGSKVVDTSKMRYTDSIIDISWAPSSRGLNFELSNVSNRNFQVLWDGAAIVDEKGESNRVVHLGVKFVDADKSQPPTPVIKGSKLVDVICPANKVKWIPYKDGGRWEQEYLFPAKKGTYLDAYRDAETSIGKTYKVLLPIKYNDKTYEYTFTFKITGAKVGSERVANVKAIANGILVTGAVIGVTVMIIAETYPR